ncbi:MAG: TolC family protein, partial [Dehalococcoidia bacterium]
MVIETHPLARLAIATLFAAGLATPAAGLPARDALRLTIDEAVALALERNEDVRVAREAVEDREAGAREIRADALPSLTGDINYTRNLKLPILFFGTDEGTQQISIGEENAYDFSLNLEQTIDIFGRVPKALGVAHLFSEIGEEDLRRV